MKMVPMSYYELLMVLIPREPSSERMGNSVNIDYFREM